MDNCLYFTQLVGLKLDMGVKMDPIVTYIPSGTSLSYTYTLGMFGWMIPVCFEDDERIAHEMRSFGHLSSILNHFHEHLDAGDLKGRYSFKYESGHEHSISLKRLLSSGHPDHDLERIWKLDN